jgi:hypothetical protein
LDNTLINYDRAAAYLAQATNLGQIDNVEGLKEFYRKRGNYSKDWLNVQEWLYTDGLKFADLAAGTIEVLKKLQERGYSVVIVSHKTSLSAKNCLDLHSPAREWLEQALAEVDFDLDRNLFFEQDRSRKIYRIREERVTNFVDDLLEVFLEPEFPQEVRGFWLEGQSKEALPSNVVPIHELRMLLQYV